MDNGEGATTSRLSQQRDKTAPNPKKKNRNRNNRKPSKTASTSSASSTKQLVPSSLHAYDPPTDTWLAFQSPTGPPATLSPFPAQSSSSIWCLTWNTWSTSPSHSFQQTRAIVNTVLSSGAQVVSLQEVSSELYGHLRANESVRAEFVMTGLDEYLLAAWKQSGPVKGRGKGKMEAALDNSEREGVVLLMRRSLLPLGGSFALGFVKLKCAKEEIGGKAVIVLDLFPGTSQSLRILTSHFTSLPLRAPIRHSQYAHCLSLLSSSPIPSSKVLLGDFNHSLYAELSPLLSPRSGLVDPFAHLHPQSLDFFRSEPTFGELYPYMMGAPRSKTRKVRRVDLVLVGGALRPVAYESVGREMVRDEIGTVMLDDAGKQGVMWASDHAGVLVRLEREVAS